MLISRAVQTGCPYKRSCKLLIQIDFHNGFTPMSSGIYLLQRSVATLSRISKPVQQSASPWRTVFVMVWITAVLAVCGGRLAQLQLLQGSLNRQLADQNRIRPIPIPAERGNITDRRGQLLATTQLSRAVYLWPRQRSPQQWQQVASHLGSILNVPAEEIIQRLERAGYRSALPVRISQQVTPATLTALAEASAQLSGVEILYESKRQYPHGSLAAHVLGYIGEATEEDMAANPNYPSGMIVGRMGIERLANKQLEGTWGSRLIEVDAAGKESRVLGSQPAIAGDSVQLTLDMNLQQAAERALNNRRGAVVVLDVKTGGVLALASGPTFDPTIFTRPVKKAEWDRLQGQDKPFLNRALQGYPPGSTFKMVTAVAGMESGKYSPRSTIATSAFVSLGGIQFWESSRSGHGVIGFARAIAVSSNTFFFRIGMAVGPDAIARWGKALGIGTSAELGLEGEMQGMIPTPEEKEQWYGEPWYAGDTVSMSIGQGLVQATPMELAVMIAAIANGGQRVHPHLLSSQTGTPSTRPQATGIKPEAIEILQRGLVQTVQSGTARRLNDGSIPLTAGKTGTSEVPSGKPNAMYVGYGPAKEPQIAIAVVVENGGYGGVTAVPIAHEVYRAYFRAPSGAPQK